LEYDPMATTSKQRRSQASNGRTAVVKLSRAEIVQSLELAARERTGLSARVLLRRYRLGKLQNPSAVSDLVALSNLLRKNDPILAE
jgi:hypothetical protein